MSNLAINKIKDNPDVGSISSLARKIGMDRSHLSRVLRGEAGASFDNLSKIADSLGISLDELRVLLLTP